jgi:HAMP domain-containing protein
MAMIVASFVGAMVLLAISAVLFRSAFWLMTASQSDLAELRREDASKRRHHLVYNRKRQRFEAGR